MPRNYSGVFDGVLNTSGQNLINIEEATGTNVQCEIYEILIGSRATPASDACTYIVARTTADATGGTVPSVMPLNPDTPASLSTLRINVPVGTTATYGTSLWELSLNKQNTYRWVTQPGNGTGLYSAHAVTTDGIGLKTLTPTNAFAVDGHIMWQE